VGLPGSARPSPEAGLVPTSFDPARSYRDTRSEWEATFEKAYVRWLLDRHGGNISAAARAADMDRKYLHKLARRHAVHPAQSGDPEADD
jgi:DNA-binding NtrC family response regulator